MSRLDAEIDAFSSYISPTRSEIAFRHSIVVLFTRVVRALWPTALVHVFGSLATKFFLPTRSVVLLPRTRAEVFSCSDIDVVVMCSSIKQLSSHFILHTLRDALISTGFTTSSLSQVVINARVPLVKFTSTTAFGSLAFDVSFNSMHGPLGASRMHELLEELGDYARVRKLLLVLKMWLSGEGLMDVRKGGLGGMSLSSMVVLFFQVRPLSFVAKHDGADRNGAAADARSQHVAWLRSQQLSRQVYGSRFAAATSRLRLIPSRVSGELSQTSHLDTRSRCNPQQGGLWLAQPDVPGASFDPASSRLRFGPLFILSLPPPLTFLHADIDLSSGMFAINCIRSLFQRAIASLLPFTDPDATSIPTSNSALGLLWIFPSPEMLHQREQNERLWESGEVAEMGRSWTPAVDEELSAPSSSPPSTRQKHLGRPPKLNSARYTLPSQPSNRATPFAGPPRLDRPPHLSPPPRRSSEAPSFSTFFSTSEWSTEPATPSDEHCGGR